MSVRNTNALKRSRLSAALITALVVPFAGSAVAQEASQTTQQAPQATSTLDKVTVTGSRIKKAEIEGPAPVTVITAADIEKQGFSTVYDALNTLTQFTGSVQNELNQNGFTPNASFLNLRGLGPGYQLVLINGRRAADYPLPYNGQSNAVNLANIPAGAIERIEVLSGGASAIYGSDAVAGVVNVIMKTNFEGDQFNLRVGTTTMGGGDSGRLQWVGGKIGERASLTYAFEILEREAIYGRQREFMDSYRDDPSIDPANATALPGVRYTMWVDANGNPTSNPSAPGRRLGWPMAGNLNTTCSRFSEFEPVAVNGQAFCGYYGYPAGQAIRNSDKNFNAYLYGTYELTDTIQAWAQLGYSNSEAKLASSSRTFTSASVTGANNFYDPNVGAVIGNVYRTIAPSEIGNGGGAPTLSNEQSLDFATGLRGTVFDGRFDWDATLSHSRYKSETKYNWLVQSKVRDFFFGQRLGTHAGTGYAIYALNLNRLTNPLSSADYTSITSSYRDEASSQVSQGSFVLSGDLFEMPAGSLAMAAVLEAASQKYDVSPDARARLNYTGNDAPMGLTSTGGGGSRDRYSVGVEFSIPLLSTLKASLAGRYDKFDDASAINGAFTWSSGLEWRPVDSLLLRGSYATSFKAPDMHYIYAGESGFYTYAFDEYACRAAGLNPTSTADCGGSLYNPQVFGTRKGDPRLKAEEGKSYTAGVVWDVMDDLSLTVDYYNIKLEGAISDLTGRLYREEAACRLGTNRDGSAVDPTSARCIEIISRVMRDGNGDIAEIATYPQNQAQTNTSGVDSRISYRVDTDRMGDFIAELGWTHVLKFEAQQYVGEEFENQRDNPQFFNFRSRVNWQVGWNKDDWNFNVNGYRWGSLPNWAETGRIAPYIIWNARVEKKITEKATVGLAVNNVLNKLHPNDDTFNSYPYFWRAFSPIGREVFVSFNYKFN
ncbi:MAG: TonB-dependent receptor [Xanthomonas sp.]|uniref:TonB-dependent receptor plug domain-containing protein n=1 Tax=Pseudoxanthomonas mexicana TaxID=128785 RepID=UPI0007836894|nr:TonB-dependent receptor [Pseudoxanthomonas mexicana]MBA3929327.1 TonB-dependent receptor [Xanthomonas sp.]